MKKIKQDIIQQDKIKTTKLEQDNAGRRKKKLSKCTRNRYRRREIKHSN